MKSTKGTKNIRVFICQEIFEIYDKYFQTNLEPAAERLRITKKTLIANVVALGTVTTGTGNTTWDVTKHQMAIITTGHGNTDITIAYANDAATGLGSTLLVNDTGKSSNLNITMAGASPPGIKYPDATAPTINSTDGETLVVSFINTGSGQLVASSVTTANTT